MTRDEFRGLVGQLEQLAASNPRGYKARVLALGTLGYGYILFILITTLLLALAVLAVGVKSPAVALKLGLPLLAFCAMVLRALWVRLEAPQGVPLERSDQPALFKILDKVRRKLKGPRLHSVLLTNDFNASIVQVPRLGLLGWQKNYLLIGLPLMQALSPKQFAAVLAHEYGHLAGAHGRSSAWIYRIRQSWFRLMEALESKPHWGQAIVRRFFNWYAPYFSAYSFVLARQEEYEADRQAARVSGAREAADALINVALKGRYLQEAFWPSLYAQASTQPHPAMSPFMDMGRLLHSTSTSQDAGTWLKQALERKTDSDDTHPCLRDRIRALGESPRVPEPVKVTAAEYFFGDELGGLAQQFTDNWRREVEPDWRQRYEEAEGARQRIAKLEAAGELAIGEAYEYARLIEGYCPAVDPLPYYQKVAERAPDHAQAVFNVGRILLERGDESGVAHIKKAMQMAPPAVMPGCELLYHHCMAKGRAQEAELYAERYRQQAERERASDRERNTLNFNDELIEHDLEPDRLQALVDQLRAYRRISRVYVARKALKLSERPLYVIGLDFRGWWRSDEAADGRFVDKVLQSLRIDYEAYVVVLNAANKPLKRTLMELPDALVFKR